MAKGTAASELTDFCLWNGDIALGNDGMSDMIAFVFPEDGEWEEFVFEWEGDNEMSSEGIDVGGLF
jgi:hypothetical protein